MYIDETKSKTIKKTFRGGTTRKVLRSHGALEL